MSSSGQQKISQRHFVLCILVVSCFLVLFFLYYKPEISFNSFGLYMEKINYSPPPVAFTVEAQTQPSTQNCTTVQPITRNNTQTKPTVMDTVPDTTLLIWIWPFGQKTDLSCSSYNIIKCHLTDDRSLYHKAHGVILHHRDIQGNLGILPQEPRPSFQKWVWFNMESPKNSARVPGLNNLFNLTCNYRLDSSIPVPYGHLEPLPPEDQPFKLPTKDKLVCWIVSNWNSGYKRVQYYNSLKKSVKINAYGSAFGQHLSNEDYTKIVSSCKFYLSFENSVYKDYITEKLFRPMELGTVPIVLGPSRQNYEEHIPGDSFIHVNDFDSPQKLAERIRYLDTNEGEYMKYFEWKKSLRVKSSEFIREHACRSCRYIQKNRGNDVFPDLNKWYWG